MPDSDPQGSSERLSAEHVALLRAAAAKAIPLPPVEPLLEKWKRLHSPAKPGEVVPLADYTAPDALAFAARSGRTISTETRAKLAQLVREMTGLKSPADGR